MNTQFNHPLELTIESKQSLRLLANSGVVLGNQMVLLKGINDNKYLVRLLNQELLSERVRPYYIFHAKNVCGTTHFRTPLDTGIKIIEYLGGNTSGLAIPTYIFSAPNGLGKIPLTPNYIDSITEDRIYLHTWENQAISLDKTVYTLENEI